MLVSFWKLLARRIEELDARGTGRGVVFGDATKETVLISLDDSADPSEGSSMRGGRPSPSATRASVAVGPATGSEWVDGGSRCADDDLDGVVDCAGT